MFKGGVDSFDKVADFVSFCKDNNVEQFTARPIVSCGNDRKDIYDWIEGHRIGEGEYVQIVEKFLKHSTKLRPLSHGAIVLDYKGQNLCLSNCLTESSEDETDIRQLIYFPDGHVRYSWNYEGAILF